MSLTAILVLVLGLNVGAYSYTIQPCDTCSRPEQVHLALGRNESEMRVSWVTEHPYHCVQVVENGTDPQDEKKELDFQDGSNCGYQFDFDAGEITERNIHINQVELSGLRPDTVYNYRIKSLYEEYGDSFNSNWFSFKTLPTINQTTPSPKVAFFGNMGLYNNEMASLELLKKMALNREMDVVVHIGDMAYDLKTDEGRRGDEFMNAVEPIASHVPYQVVAGDHESQNDLSYAQYTNRFTMINKTGDINNFFYSFNVGLIHFIGLNTQYHIDNQLDKMAQQYRWLEQDLAEANRNRETRPWIVVLMHHQIYCQNEQCHDCNDCQQHQMSKLLGHDTNLEELFYRHGVDVVTAAHDRVYQRTLPIFKNVECKSLNNEDPYDQPRGPVHVTSGAAGGNINWPKTPLPNAFRVHKEGVSLIHSVTRDTLTIDYILADGNRADRFTIKNTNRSGPRYSCTEAEQQTPPIPG